jgi:hypothetical protein
MATEERPADYVCVYTIALLPNVTEKDFERHVIEEVWPNFSVTHRPTGAVDLRHSLQERRDPGGADRYVWEIRVRFVQRISKVPDEAALKWMDELVRAALESFGLPISLTVFREVAHAQGR